MRTGAGTVNKVYQQIVSLLPMVQAEMPPRTQWYQDADGVLDSPG